MTVIMDIVLQIIYGIGYAAFMLIAVLTILTVLYFIKLAYEKLSGK